ncbi:MAG: hypothetical protein GF315_09095 [candidate division Zixibacteria bacterium]|nr:hypothetical protein [candidate division Zixibacteria bacterium]
MTKPVKPAIIVHGGAWKIPKYLWKKSIMGCEDAVKEGYKILISGESAIKAVTEAVRIMENNQVFDAGVGALLNLIGEVELDAIVIDGENVTSGAVAVVRNIKNPILLALKVMELTPHRLLAGKGAEMFAAEVDIPKCKTTDLIVGRELKRYEQLKKNKKFKIPDAFRDKHGGTVGAVAIDINGKVAAATSTGGVPKKLPGRVGDTPIIGSGAFADNRAGAASATGWGESIMKAALSKTACDYLAKNHLAQRSATLAVKEMENRWNGLGGVIVVDKKGNPGIAHNTPQMAYARISRAGTLKSGIATR